MNRKQTKTMNAFWTGAIVISMLLVLFALVFVSCAKPVETDETPDAPEQAEQSPSPELPDAEAPDVSGSKPNEAPAEGTPEDEQPETPDAQESSSPDAPPEEKPESTSAPQTPPPEQSYTQLAETEDMGRDYLDRIYFLGDSTTYGLGYYYNHGYTDLVPPTQVWTPSSGTLTLDQWNYVAILNPDTGEELMLTDLLALKQPEYLCITLGVNGVSFMKEEYFKQSYTALVQKVQEVSPDTTVILNSIYPVTVGYEAKNNGINNLKIEAANLWIQSVAQSCGVHYLDSASVLRNDDRVLPDSYTNGDGLHLNGEAFGLVVGYIRTHGC